MLTRLSQHLKRFGRDRSGVIALKFAFIAPAVVLLVAGAIDLNAVHASKARLQDVADAAALAGAWELGLAIDDDAAVARAETYVQGHVEDWNDAPAIDRSISVTQDENGRVMTVRLNGHRTSFFGNLLPPGGWKFVAEARATTVGLTPLCVLVSGTSGSKLLNVKDNGRISAPACLVHSNRDIEVEGGSIAAAMVQAATSAKGVISPEAGTGAERIDDPFARLLVVPPLSCSNGVKGLLGGILGKQYKSGVVSLPPGIHCGGLKASGNAQVTLLPGEHWFLLGALEITEGARLTGTDVVLLFDTASKFDFKDQSTVNLEGRKSGRFAGMVMAATRTNTQDFIISSDNVDKLLGVIYVPNAQMIVEGKQDVARDSAWTVIVAKSVQLKGSPSLIVNADYEASAVPVPQGVGPRPGGSRLVE